ncbi:MAG TPA: ankyrin repeat domain-containing protein [Rariglobus sp.]|nr:ankyrin repeat domain-containing protein [Rariglobus sp.]
MIRKLLTGYLLSVVVTVCATFAADDIPGLALAPVSPEQLEGQEKAGEALTTLLVAKLSGDSRWEMVERGDLSLLAGEWQLGKAGFIESSNAVTQGRLLRADWVLVCRPEMTDVENPAAKLEVIDAVRAELLASRTIKLAQRPHARWFRSPPAGDVELIVKASREALIEARAARERLKVRKVAASLFFSGDDGRLDAELASLMEGADGGNWRLLNPLHPDVARGEGLLKAAGFVSGERGPALEKIADAYIWGRLGSSTTGAGGRSLKFWIWRGGGLPEEKRAEGSMTELAGAIKKELLAGVPAAGSTDPLVDQIQLAKRLIEEALAVAPATEADFKQSRRLLEMAAFFAPQDRVVQETRLAFTLASRRIKTGLTQDDRMRLRLEYARLADAFWRGPGNTLDARLLEASFSGYARGMPGQRERALQSAPLLVQAPLSELIPHKELFHEWTTYCRRNPVSGQRMLEIIWPVVAKLLPEILYTQPTKTNVAKTGWVNLLMEDESIDQVRLKEILDGSAKGMPSLVVEATGARYRIVDSPAPNIGGGVLGDPLGDRTTEKIQAPVIQKIAETGGFFKFLADYERDKTAFTSGDAASVKRQEERDARREQQIARLEIANPEAARQMRESFERNRKQTEERRSSLANRSLDAIREYAVLQSKNGTIPAPGINDRQSDDSTPLSIAVAKGWPEVAEIFIKAGADPLKGLIRNRSIRDFAAADPVMSRILAGKQEESSRGGAGMDGEAVVALLRKGDRVALANATIGVAILDYKDTRGWTVLHHAIERQADDFALRLIAAGAPLEAPSIGGQTPLAFAAFKASTVVTKVLLAKKADPNGRASELAAPPLLAACIGGDVALVRILLAAGADVNATSNGGVPLVVDAARDSPNAEVVKALVDAGVRLDVADASNLGPLETSMVKDRVKTLRYLLDNGGKWRRAKTEAGSSPLIVAAQNEAVACVQLLLERGERDDRARQFTSNPAIRAMLEDKMQQTGAGTKALDDDVLWPVILADKQKWKERMDAHLAKGGNVNFTSIDWTPLLLAIQTRNLECVRYVLAKGADPKVHPSGKNLRDRTTLNGMDFMERVLSPHTGSALSPIGEQQAYRAELITLLVPAEPSDDYERALGRSLVDKQWEEATAYVRAGVGVEIAKAYLAEAKKLTEKERAQAWDVLKKQ